MEAPPALGTLVGLLAGTLRVDGLERRAAGLLGVRARALICASPEICMDIDAPAMLAVVRERLTRDPRAPSSRHAEGMAGW